MRRPRLSTAQVTLLLTIVTFLGALVANVATGTLPPSWEPYLWVAWPLTGLFLLLTIGLTVRSLRDRPDTTHQRILIANKVAARIKRALDDKLPDHTPRISLDLSNQPRAILPKPQLRLERARQAPSPIPADTSIAEVFANCGRGLLILGQPGAGKSTLLLELAQALVIEAESAKEGLLPIVLHLDNWAQRRDKLEEWFAREVSESYGVGITLARRWIEEDTLIPLLDGLDEVAPEQRAACVAAINAFHRDHGTLPIVVCSRTNEYEELQNRLALEHAVCVEPLTPVQIGNYLRAGGTELQGLAEALTRVSVLRNLLTTPLVLSVAALAFAGRSSQSLDFRDPQQAETQLWTAYVQLMVSRQPPSNRKTVQNATALLHYLIWLAQTMQTRSLSTFYIERLQPDWLPERASRRYHLLGGGFSFWHLQLRDFLAQASPEQLAEMSKAAE